MNGPSLLVVGHWMVDHIVTLPAGSRLSDPLPSEHIHVPIVSQLGGSGYHFAVAAKLAGFENVTSILCHGNDRLWESFHTEISTLEFDLIRHECSGPSAQAILIYDAGDHRSSFGDRGPNLAVPSIARGEVESGDYDIVFVAGHLLEDPGAEACVLEMVRLAHESGSFVVFDFVPHHMGKLVGRHYIESLTSNVDGVIGYTHTLSSTLGHLSDPDTYDMSVFLDDLLTRFRWACVHPDNQQIWIGRRTAPGTQIYQIPSGYTESKIKAGAHDLAVARELLKYALEVGLA